MGYLLVELAFIVDLYLYYLSAAKCFQISEIIFKIKMKLKTFEQIEGKIAKIEVEKVASAASKLYAHTHIHILK